MQQVMIAQSAASVERECAFPFLPASISYRRNNYAHNKRVIRRYKRCERRDTTKYCYNPGYNPRLERDASLKASFLPNGKPSRGAAMQSEWGARRIQVNGGWMLLFRLGLLSAQSARGQKREKAAGLLSLDLILNALTKSRDPQHARLR